MSKESYNRFYCWWNTKPYKRNYTGTKMDFAKAAWDEQQRVIEQKEKALDDLRKKFGITHCAYCGESFEMDKPDLVNELNAHIIKCDKHPLTRANVELAKWRDLAARMAFDLEEFSDLECIDNTLADYKKLKEEK